MELVSIVVCTYNGERFLAEQLESLLGQSYQHLEIIISDDCSTDNTLSIARDFAARDSRIKLHVQPHNLGYNKNFESAFQRATGSLIAVSDQDDIWKKEKIATLVPLFTGKVLLAYGQSVRFKERLPEVEHYTARKIFEGNEVKKLMFFNTIPGHNMIFRKELLLHAAPFPEHIFYDWWLLICAAAYGEVAGTEAVLGFHRYHESNLTLGKKDEKKQTAEKAGERLRTARAIQTLDGLDEEEKAFARQLEKALQSLEGKKFSLALFFFLARHAGTVFFFKRKSFFSKLKMAYRLSFAQ